MTEIERPFLDWSQSNFQILYGLQMYNGIWQCADWKFSKTSSGPWSVY